MLNLKQLFFCVVGVNCLFLIGFFVTVRSPDSFNANTLAFSEIRENSVSEPTQEPDQEPEPVPDVVHEPTQTTNDYDSAQSFLAAISDGIQLDAPNPDTLTVSNGDNADSTDDKVTVTTTNTPDTTTTNTDTTIATTNNDGDDDDNDDDDDDDDDAKSLNDSDDNNDDDDDDDDGKDDNDSDDDGQDERPQMERDEATLQAVNAIIVAAQDKLQRADLKLSNALRRRNKVQNVLRWNNPFFLLGGYGKVLKRYFNSYPDGRPYYSKFNYGVINDPDYCEIVDSWNLAHPENMFETMNFFTDYAKNGLVRRDVIRKIGKDTMTRVSRYMPKENFYSAQYHLDPTITNFFTKRVDIHIYHMIGKNFNCATQMYNHIPGHGVLKRKDLIVDSVDNYAQVYQDQGLGSCFNKHTFFPYSYRLYIKEECRAFFTKINSQEYKNTLIKEPIQYLIKLGFGAHRANGVFLLDKNETEYMNELYDNGYDCGQVKRSVIAQTYVTNPLLLDKNNKFDFRVYMLVASTNPLIVYYHDGFLRVSLETYNKNSDDRNVHLTNTHLSKDAFAEAEKTNATLAQELRDYQMWTFEDLEEYLLESKKITDPKWLDNYLRPAFKQAFIHTTRMSAYAFWNASNVYEMFGLDFMLDDQMNLWFIECNSSPQLIGTNDHKTKFLIKMLSDLFEIQYGYYRSRMKRVLNLINKVNAQGLEKGHTDYNNYKEEYAEAMKNRFEPEYNISANNSFELIMDLSLEGPKAYFNNIPDQCAN